MLPYSPRSSLRLNDFPWQPSPVTSCHPLPSDGRGEFCGTFSRGCTHVVRLPPGYYLSPPTGLLRSGCAGILRILLILSKLRVSRLHQISARQAAALLLGVFALNSVTSRLDQSRRFAETAPAAIHCSQLL